MIEHHYTLRAASAASGLPEDRLRRACIKRTLRHVRSGQRGRIYIPESSLHEWIRAQTYTAAQELPPPPPADPKAFTPFDFEAGDGQMFQ
jgi:hypothetical protein